MRLTRTLLGALALSLMSLISPASAKDHPLTGFFIGASFGHLQTGSTVMFDRSQGQINDVSGNTILPGAVGGYSQVFDSGFFAGVDVWALKATEPYPSTIVEFGGRQYLVERDWELGLMARAGWTIGERNALYGSAGVAISNVTYTIDGDRSPRVLWTPTFGLGAELAVTDNVALRGDWHYDWVQQDLGPVQVKYEFRTRASASVVYRF